MRGVGWRGQQAEEQGLQEGGLEGSWVWLGWEREGRGWRDWGDLAGSCRRVRSWPVFSGQRGPGEVDPGACCGEICVSEGPLSCDVGRGRWGEPVAGGW